MDRSIKILRSVRAVRMASFYDKNDGEIGEWRDEIEKQKNIFIMASCHSDDVFSVAGFRKQSNGFVKDEAE